jgi:hypothetical protein
LTEIIESQLPQLVGVLGTEAEVRKQLHDFLPTLKRW